MRAMGLALMGLLLLGAKGGNALPETKSITKPGAKLEKLADGFDFTEGCASDANGNVFFTDQPNNRIWRWSVDGKLTKIMEPCGRSNGLCFDAAGNMWACADEKNELWLIPAANGFPQNGQPIDAQPIVLVKDHDSKLLNGPNDIWVRPDGGAYFTDPYYQRPYWNRGPIEQAHQGVYYLAPDHKTLREVVTDTKQANGIIGTPDGKTLYVADIGAGQTFAYHIGKDGSLSGKKLFCTMGSDGMTIDNEGDVYLTGKAGVTVFNRAGKKVAQIDVPEDWTGNVCFGGKDKHLLFIAASKGIYGMQMRTHGVGSQ